jgi:predicted AAA+ superfamily ATPase
MDRALYHQLIDWKMSKNRKPLVLQGARQVGKTFLLKTFAKKTILKPAISILKKILSINLFSIIN